MSKLLLINDLAGYGKVALSAMIPILSHMQYEVCSLPTALVSNTLDYGKFEILETTSYMKNTLQVWDALGFAAVFAMLATRYPPDSSSPARRPSWCGTSAARKKPKERGFSQTPSWAMRANSTTALAKKPSP